MSMSPCPECGKEISTRAEACSHCGFPPRPSDAEREILAIRRRVLTGGTVLSAIGIPAGLVLGLWPVAVLGAVGLAVGMWKLNRLSPLAGTRR
ncbi:MAG: zinc ribbon domain-containing protein [bacterium]|nr:zinc ribbon domain-containing protein [bacterium]